MRREAARLAEEVDDLLDFVLGLVDARDVLERDDLVAPLGDLARARSADAPGGRAIDGEAEERRENAATATVAPQLSAPGSGAGSTSTRTSAAWRGR